MAGDVRLTALAWLVVAVLVGLAVVLPRLQEALVTVELAGFFRDLVAVAVEVAARAVVGGRAVVAVMLVAA